MGEQPTIQQPSSRQVKKLPVLIMNCQGPSWPQRTERRRFTSWNQSYRGLKNTTRCRTCTLSVQGQQCLLLGALGSNQLPASSVPQPCWDPCWGGRGEKHTHSPAGVGQPGEAQLQPTALMGNSGPADHLAVPLPPSTHTCTSDISKP